MEPIAFKYIRFCPGVIGVYGITIKIAASLAGSLWLVFPLFLWKNKPKTSQKLCRIRDYAVKFELDTLNFHGNDHTKYGKWLKNTGIFEAPCIENYKLSLEAYMGA